MRYAAGSVLLMLVMAPQVCSADPPYSWHAADRAEKVLRLIPGREVFLRQHVDFAGKRAYAPLEIARNGRPGRSCGWTRGNLCAVLPACW